MTPRTANQAYDLAAAAHDFAAWQGLPRRTVLVCSHPRSGSTLLGEALHFAGGLGCPLEYFHRGFRPSFERRWQTHGLAELVGAAHRWRTDPSGVFGVKLFWQDVEDMACELDPQRFAQPRTLVGDAGRDYYRALWAALAPIFPNPSFVYLDRRDRLRQAASAVAAVQSGHWRSLPTGANAGSDSQVAYDDERMYAQLALADYARTHWRAFFEAIGQTPITLTYESLDRDYDATVAATLARLGSSAAVPPQRMRRQAGPHTESLVLEFLRRHAVDRTHDAG